MGTALLLLLALGLSGCTGALIDQLQERHVSSCIWTSSPLSSMRAVTATGSATIAECLAVPCRGH